MPSKMLEGLQSRFKCLNCGKCCEYGGDMEITAVEVGEIVINASALYGDKLGDEFVPVPNKPGRFKFRQTFPCGFYDKQLRKCGIYENRPQACRNYPFCSLAKGETTLAGVTICEGASRQVTEEFFNDKDR